MTVNHDVTGSSPVWGAKAVLMWTAFFFAPKLKKARSRDTGLTVIVRYANDCERASVRRLFTNLLVCRAEFYEFPRKRSIPLCGMHDVNVASRVCIAKAVLMWTAFFFAPQTEKGSKP